MPESLVDKDLPKYGMDADLAAKEAAKYNPADEKLVCDWIAACTGQSKQGEFMAWLKDGQVLVNLANVLGNAGLKANESKMPFKQMENISNFLKACREKLGMRENDLFTTADLYDEKSRVNVINGLIATSRAASKSGFKGPSIAPKESASGAVPHWDVSKASAEVSKLSMGSAGIMEQGHIDRSRNIGFGADAAGQSVAQGGATKLSMGSAGTMPAHDTVKQGITFGDKAGKGEFTKQ